MYLERQNPAPGVLLGTPKLIRSDEWFVAVPWFLSQIETQPKLPTDNPSIGAETSALLVGLPTSHWTTIFRPSHWGFFFLDVERGFSWYWLCRTVLLFGALTLLFLELTGGALVWALSGAIWIFFSSFTQWWLGSVAEIILGFVVACLSLRAIFVSGSVAAVCIASIALLISSMSFALTLYPPFQIPLAYLGVALLPLLLEGAGKAPGPKVWVRIGMLSFVGTCAAASLVFFLQANSEAIRLMEGTVYPGRRVSLGGGMSIARYFGGFFDQLYDQARFPSGMGNICEASSVILLWPLSLVLLTFAGTRYLWLRCAPLILFLLSATAWSFWGIPESVATLSLWSFVTTTRVYIGFMIGGTILSVVAAQRMVARGILLPALTTLGVAVALWWYTNAYHESIHEQFAIGELRYAALVVFCIALSLIWRSRVLLMCSLGVACIYPHGLVNPVMQGMKSVTGLKFVRSLERFDPRENGLWVVFGSTIHAQLTKVAGHKVINGSQYVPDIEFLSTLDPDGQSAGIYNRYALQAYAVGTPNSQPTFTLLAPDTWQLTIDPCDERLKAKGVTYMVWAPYDPDTHFSCFERIFVQRDYAVYKRR